MMHKVTAMLVIRGLAVAAILSVGLAAFRLSFVTLRELAVMAGIGPADAWLFPVVIDVTTATAAVLALVASDRQVRLWFTWVLGVGTVVSIAGNAVHAATHGERLPTWACALVASVAPIALLVDVHGVILLLRSATAPEPATDSAPAEFVAAPAVPTPVEVEEPRALEPVPDPPMVAVSVAVTPQPRPLPIARPFVPVVSS
ncbi:DUF2637 domain-containing protein [Nocardia tengchongensis]|uniref:DUF2637 domain-containing protein n=1 Tax=Nocardia tengchongensis TaxID=2055889 RepID=UPI0033F004B8